jgi:hypothetical protein
MKRILGFAPFCVALLCASPVYAATCAPQSLVHIVAVNVTPGLPASSLAAKPQGVYRLGANKLRIEEALAPNGTRSVIVVDEPDVWTANLDDRDGKHVIDSGTALVAEAPVFGFGIPSTLSALEFGCESNFIAANAPTPVGSEQIGDKRFNVYRVAAKSDAVEILEQSGTSTPAFARYYHQGKLVESLQYELYATGLTNNLDLFSRPLGVRYIEELPH